MTKHLGDPPSREPLTLSNDAARIASALASPRVEAPDPSMALVEALIQQRALRFSYLPGELLHDPAWDMLLELFHAELSGRSLVEPILCKAAFSASTGSRWIDALVKKGLCVRSIDPSDATTVFVNLSVEGSQAMRSYFVHLSDLADAAP